MITALSIAETFLGVAEIPGAQHNPLIVWMLQQVLPGTKDDETAWCSAFVNHVAKCAGAQQSHSAAARSWLKVGTPVSLGEAKPGFTVAVFKRGEGNQPGPEVIAAPGHVAFFKSYRPGFVMVVGGNQGNKVSMMEYPESRLLALRNIS